jgi:heptosyltransferase-2
VGFLSILSKKSVDKILIVGPSWVGDMVMAQSLFMVLKSQYPKSKVDVLAPAWSFPIIERMPEVNKSIEMPLGHGRFGLGERRRFGHSLRKEKYDWAIVLPNSWKSALIPWFAKIPRRTAWKGEMRYGLINDIRHLDKQALPLMVQRFVSLGFDEDYAKLAKNSIQDCPKPCLKVESKEKAFLLNTFKLNDNKPTLILCPGAEFGSAKQWPSNYFQSVASEFIALGWQVWIMGSKADNNIAQSICEVKDKDVVNLCGETTLGQAIDLMALADKVISNDSGLMHIAAALNKPIVALYGPTSPGFTPPMTETAKILSVDVDCGPCFKRECPEGHHDCMQGLKPDLVMKAIMSETV